MFEKILIESITLISRYIQVNDLCHLRPLKMNPCMPIDMIDLEFDTILTALKLISSFNFLILANL